MNWKSFFAGLGISVIGYLFYLLVKGKKLFYEDENFKGIPDRYNITTWVWVIFLTIGGIVFIISSFPW